MKKTVLAATIAFWCFMFSAVIAGKLSQPAQLAQAPAAKQYTLKEVAQHATAKDCWMAIGGQVYDFSAYIPQHPAAPEVMTRHCGKEATRAFETKDRGRPHSDYAQSLLTKYRIGSLRE
jgi:cytochrome b involved in lipid metabolism